MESPESLQLWHPRVATGGAQQQSMIYARDASSRSFRPHNPDKETTIEYGWLKAGVGLPLGFEFTGKAGSINGSSSLGAKFQVFGPRAGEGKANSNSLAITGAAVFGGYGISGDQDGVFGRGGHNWSAQQHFWGSDVALIFGHRPSERIIIFGGPFYTNWKFTSRIRHELSDDGNSPEATYYLEGEGNRRGINLAVEWSTLGKVARFYLVPEVVVSQLQWSNHEEATHLDWGITTGLRF